MPLFAPVIKATLADELGMEGWLPLVFLVPQIYE